MWTHATKSEERAWLDLVRGVNLTTAGVICGAPRAALIYAPQLRRRERSTCSLLGASAHRQQFGGRAQQ